MRVRVVLRQRKIGLPAANKLEIHIGENFRIEQRAVQRARRIVDSEPAAQRIQRGRRPRKAFARNRQRIQRLFPRQLGEAHPLQLGIQEFHVKRGIVDHQLGVAHEIQEFLPDLREYRLVLQKVDGQPVHLERLLRHVAFRVDVLMIGAPGGDMVQQLDSADFHDPIALFRVESRRFRIKYDFTHCAAPPGWLRRCFAPARAHVQAYRSR